MHVLSAADNAWVTRLCGTENACPEPARVPSLNSAICNPAEERLPRHRAITDSDRLLLWLGDTDALAAREATTPATDGLVTYALTRGADVWLVSQAHRACAAALIDCLGITLCSDSLATDHPLSVRCVGAAGEPVQSGLVGLLIWDGSAPADALSVGYIDAAGWVHVLGAANDALTVPDGLLAPFEGEQRLLTHSRVTGACLLAMSPGQCAAVGLEAGFFGVAEVVGQVNPVLEVELLDYLRRGLSAIKCPHGIVCVANLPTRMTGAPDRAALRALIEREFSALPAI